MKPIGLLIFTVAFMLAFVISSRIITQMITGTDTGSTLITAVWLLVLAGVGLAGLVIKGFAGQGE